MWDDFEGRIKAELDGKERLLWAGQPRLGIILRPGDAFRIPFYIVVFCGFSMFCEAMVIFASASLFLGLLAILFMLLGLYFSLGRLWVDALQRASTYYAVTDERVIVISGVLRPSIRSLNVDRLCSIRLTATGNGSGSITFGFPGAEECSPLVFEMIDCVRKVYESIRWTQCERRKGVDPSVSERVEQPVDFAEYQVATELDPDERLLWAGTPRQAVVFRATDLAMIPFGLLFCGVMFLFEATAITQGDLLIAFLGLPVFFGGIYFLITRFWLDAEVRDRIYYGVTTRRIIIIWESMPRMVTSVDLRDLTNLSFTERFDGSGSITLGPCMPPLRRTESPGLALTTASLSSFEMIQNVRQVYEIICERGQNIRHSL